MVESGWFPDPIDRVRLRYWDGTAWTDETRDASESDEAPRTSSPWAAPWAVDAPQSTPRPILAPHAPPVAVRPPSRVRGVVVAGLVVVLLAGAGYGGWKVYDAASGDDAFDAPGAVVRDGEGDGSARYADVTTALSAHGVRCTEATAELSRDQLVELATGSARTVGRGSARARAASAFEAAVEDLPTGSTFTTPTCGTSFLVRSGGRVRFAFLDGIEPEAATDVADLGVRLVSMAPPRMSEMVALFERRGDTCADADGTEDRADLVEDAKVRLTAAGNADATIVAELAALDALPDRPLVVRTCTTARLVGAGDTAQLIVLGKAGAPMGDGFRDDTAIAVVGP